MSAAGGPAGDSVIAGRGRGNSSAPCTRRFTATWFLALVVGGIGLIARTVYVGQWPSGFRPTLEFDSANAARTIFLSLTETQAAWHDAWLAAGVGRFLEPPVIQTLTALTYLPDGVERPWTSVLFTAASWVFGSYVSEVGPAQQVVAEHDTEAPIADEIARQPDGVGDAERLALVAIGEVEPERSLPSARSSPMSPMLLPPRMTITSRTPIPRSVSMG